MNDLNLHLHCSLCGEGIPFTPSDQQIKGLTILCSKQHENSYPILYIGKQWTNFYHNKLIYLLNENNSVIVSALGDHILILLNVLQRIKGVYDIISFGLYRTNDGILRCVALVKKEVK